MSNKFKTLVMLLFCSSVLACTSVNVSPVSRNENIDFICIEENPEVVAGDFVSGIQGLLLELGIGSEVYSVVMPSSCTYIMKYTAIYSWDLGRYLSHAEIKIFNSNKILGSATYHLVNEGGFSLSKHDSLEEKMRPVLVRMLSPDSN